MMKRLPLILSALFLAITLARVASFTSESMRAGVLGWVYSIGLGVAVYASAYWTRNATTRKAAVISLIFFVSVDAFFNFAHVWIVADRSSLLTAIGAGLYGLFPTVAVALLGWMQTSINKLPPGAKRERILADWLVSHLPKLPVSTDAETVPADESEPEAEVFRYICGVCGKSCETQNGLNAHQRKHKQDVPEPSIAGTNGHKQTEQEAR